jgi:UDP-N-acetylmuramate: L-alanyl-gamma-D-glutamyl-meso-diaminopimelate ligase
MKRGVMKYELPGSLELADRTFVYSAGLGWDAGEVFAPLGTKARCFEDLGELVAAVAAEAKAGDHVLVMSNGSFGGVHGKLLKALARA